MFINNSVMLYPRTLDKILIINPSFGIYYSWKILECNNINLKLNIILIIINLQVTLMRKLFKKL